MPPATFRFADSYKLDVKEPSGLAYIPELDRFVVIDDSSRTLVVFELTKHKLKADRLDSRPDKKDKISDFEGITYDPERRRLITVSERSRRIRVFRLLAGRRRGKLSGLRQVGDARLPKLSDNLNKGIEGLAFLPGKFAPDGRSHIVAVNEADPKAVLLIAPEALEIEHQLALPRKWDKAIGDLSDVAVDPLSGHLFLVSDESRQVLELELRIKRGKLDLAKVQRFDIEDRNTGKIKKPEGIVFDNVGDLYLTSEGSCRVYRYKRRR
jgi:uncharacterized protein YjiK